MNPTQSTFSAVSAAVLLTFLAAPSFAQEREFTLLERELDYLMQIWPGDYDNVEQTSFESAAGEPTVEHRRVHVAFERIDAPELGEQTLAVTEYWNNDPAITTRREVYAIAADEDVNALRIAVYSQDDGRYARRDNCDMLLRRDGDAFLGATSGDCSAGGTYGSYALRIGPEDFWFRESGESPWYQLEKARWFSCMIDFPREPGGRPVVTHHYIKIHDQGGAFPFVHPDGRPMVLLMRNTWSYGMQRETFFIGVMDETESGPTLVYAWGSPGADRIGVNPGYLRVQCDLDTERHVELQHRLRPDS